MTTKKQVDEARRAARSAAEDVEVAEERAAQARDTARDKALHLAELEADYASQED